MVKGVSTHQENLGELLVVVRHHGWAGCLLRHREKVVDVFDRAEGLLPEFKLDGGVQLGKSGVKVVLQDLRVGQVDGVGLMGILGDVSQVKTQSLAQPAELDFALVLQAESERLLCNLLEKNEIYRIQQVLATYLVDSFESRVVFERLEGGAVALPQELEPWGNESAIRPILVLVSANCAQ